MITENELKTISLSPIKKDFYQIWQELLEVAGKISERWDPTSTNESDPGIVLLKVLAALGDKLNYNIDKTILEAFMPSATQEESMRKLCEMLGYNIKYYRSATTPVVFSYTGTADSLSTTIPMFTAVTDIDNLVTYTTIESRSLSKTTDDNVSNQLFTEINCIEGSHQVCETNNGNTKITYDMLDDTFRYYLPEVMIAENGIFVYDYVDQTGSTSLQNRWEQVDNLNTVQPGTSCYKFGFDSRLQIPYLQFPEDIGNLMTGGIEIHYIRTSGNAGNISTRTLDHITGAIEGFVDGATEATDITSDISVTNNSAATNGRNIETINQAYNGFKKTIGTFDTLVACRDYMNKIYSLLDEVTNMPLVSNVTTADIRDDINRAFTLCELTEYGIKYSSKPVKIVNNGATVDRINSFDLILYPFKALSGSNTKTDYENSFKYSEENRLFIENKLQQNKTLSHVFKYPEKGDITCIKNYLKLNAKISTVTKINTAEESMILNNIYTAITTAFNSRELDFGEEIPFDSILATIEQADPRIKNVALDEPILYTAIQYIDDQGYVAECNISSVLANSNVDDDVAKRYYNKLVLRNILAGRIAMFNYNTDFKCEYDEQAYGYNVPQVLPGTIPGSTPTQTFDNILKLQSACELQTPSIITDYISLTDNEVVQFRAPNFRTTFTYPAYVNYFLHLTEDRTFITKDTEYALQDGEWIAFNYTTSTQNTEGSSKDVIVNKVYRYDNNDPVIIKPNFDIYDSVVWKNSHTPSKTNGYQFDNDVQNIIDPDGGTKGMFSFDVNEQVEIRELSKIEFKEAAYLYWTLNPMTLTVTVGGEDKTILNDTKNLGARFVDNTYLLKEDEYLYYTDAAKVNMAYYGPGTELSITGTAVDAIKAKLVLEDSDEELDGEQMAQMQLNAIPWIYVNFTSSNYLTAQEYQYVNLTKGDKIGGLCVNPLDLYSITGITLSNTYNDTNILKAYGKYADESELDLPAINVGTYGWRVRSKLEFDMGPEKTQTLYNTYDKITAIGEGSIGSAATTVSYVLCPTATTLPLSLKSKYRIQKSWQEIDTHISKVSGDTIIEENDFKLKTFAQDHDADSQYNFNNMNNYWTKLNVNNLTNSTTVTAAITAPLHVNIPADNFGMIAIKNGSNEDLQVTATASVIGYYNSDSLTNTTVTIPANGFCALRIGQSCDISMATTSSSQTGFVNLGPLDVIKNTYNGINEKLCYQSTSSITVPMDQLLSDIKGLGVGTEFYYNTPLDNSTVIDLNYDDDLSNPRYLYDYNNINNKFVISEISYSDMKNGIEIAKSSKL